VITCNEDSMAHSVSSKRDTTFVFTKRDTESAFFSTDPVRIHVCPLGEERVKELDQLCHDLEDKYKDELLDLDI